MRGKGRSGSEAGAGAGPLCPCGSGAAYGACCGPCHRGEAEAPSPEALMRSRYAAFALAEWGYLWDTLHADHEDRARGRGRDAFVADLARSQRQVRYQGLRILETTPPDADGAATVRFAARVRAAGKDRSFVERSVFVHDGVGWRYLTGTAEAPAA